MARIESVGQVPVLPADQIAVVFRGTPLASRLEKTSQILAGP